MSEAVMDQGDVSLVEPGRVQAMDFNKRVAIFRAAMDTRDDVREREKRLNALLEALKRALVEDFEKQNATSMKIDGAGTLYLHRSEYPRVIADKLEAFIEWLDANGHSALAKRTIHHQSLRAFYKEQVENEQPVPSDLLEVHQEIEVRLKRGGG